MNYFLIRNPKQFLIQKYLLVNNDNVADFSLGSECFILWECSLSDGYLVINFELNLIVEDVGGQWGGT